MAVNKRKCQFCGKPMCGWCARCGVKLRNGQWHKFEWNDRRQGWFEIPEGCLLVMTRKKNAKKHDK